MEILPLPPCERSLMIYIFSLVLSLSSLFLRVHFDFISYAKVFFFSSYPKNAINSNGCFFSLSLSFNFSAEKNMLFESG